MRGLSGKIFLSVLFAVLFFTASGQRFPAGDMKLVREVRLESKRHESKVRPYIYRGETRVLKKYNPASMAAGGLLFIYQNVFSPQFSASCLYQPSCSDFSKQAIQNYGLAKGILLSADRVMRCNRLAATGIHPLRRENNKVTDPVQFYRLKE